MRSRSISTDAAIWFSEHPRKQDERTKEIKRFSDGSVAGSFSLVESYQSSMGNVEPVKTVTVHMGELGQSKRRCCDTTDRTRLFHLL